MDNTLGMVNAVAGSPAYTGRALRQLSSVRYAGATALRPLGARSGVRPGTPASTVAATATTWTVQPFAGLIDGQAAVEAGPYEFAFDAVATGPVTPASASFARVDIIYVQVDDPAESDGSTVPAVTRKYLAGTVASTPPTLPARSMLLARVNVPISGGGAPTVTWAAPYSAAAGGVVDFNTKAEIDLWTSASEGQEAYSIADKASYKRIAGVWVLWSTVGGWKNYTPTISGFTLVGGVFTIAKYKVDAGLVTVKIRAAVQSMVSNPLVSLPVATSDTFTEHLPGTVAIIPGAGSEVVGMARKSVSSVTFFYHFVSGSIVYVNNISASVPIAWGATGTIAAIFSYESA